MSLTPGKPNSFEPKPLSGAGSKSLSAGGPKSLSGSSSKPPAGQTSTKSTKPSSPILSPGKAAFSLPSRSAPGSPSPPSQNPNESDQSDALAVRPGFGKLGSELVVDTNHFEMKLGNLQEIYLHSVLVEPDYERTVGKDDNGIYKTLPVELTPKKARRVLTQLLEQHPLTFCHSATDYAGILVSTTRLVPDATSQTWPVEYYEIEESMPTESKRPFSVAVQHKKTVDVLNFSKYLTSGGVSPTIKDKNDILNALNLMLSRQPNQDSKTVVIGNTRHFAKQPGHRNFEELYHGLRAWFGYERSVRGSFKGFLLQINCAASAFYTKPPNDLTLDWLIHEWSPNEVHQMSHKKELEKFIKGLRVTATYLGKLSYTVYGLAEPDKRGERPTVDNVSFMKKIYKHGTGGQNAPKAITISKKGMSAPQMKTSSTLSGKSIAAGTGGTKPRGNEYKEELTTVRKHMESLQVPLSDYQKQYGLVINVGSKSRPICIPAEKLRYEEGSTFRQLLGSTQTQRMVNYASRGARATKNLIVENGLKMFGVADGQERNTPKVAFDIGLNSTSPIQINARILDPPGLRYNSDTRDVDPGTKGSWLLREKGIMLHTVVRSPIWTIIEINDDEQQIWCDDTARDKFWQSLNLNLRRYCSAPASPAPAEVPLAKSRYLIPRTSNTTIRAGLIGMLDDVQKRNDKLVTGRKISVIFVILPSKNAAMYDTLKHLAEFEYGIHTICTVRQGEGMKEKAEFFTNLMLKCNLKMGGTNTVLNLKEDRELQTLLGNGPTMIVGADVTHAGVGSKMGTPSIVAVVASRGELFQQYPAILRCQSNRTEIIEDLEGIMVEHLKSWAKATPNGKVLPQKVIFYRDGVSEGEFNAVLTDEVSSIKKAFATVFGKHTPYPKLLFMCVVKRSSARFYPQGELTTPQEKKDGNAIMDRNYNSWPGLVVDNDVTSQVYYDFYLQSHSSIKGTAKPAHYVVIVDEIGVTPDVLQRATYWQCYTFGRSLQAISAHPAARLADVACTRGRAYLRQFLDAANDNESELGSELSPADRKNARQVREADTYAAAIKAWGTGVHPNIAGSMHYI